ncbi:MAG: hypothetical protein ACT4N5_05710 [Nitrosopumilaceae archaeon]
MSRQHDPIQNLLKEIDNYRQTVGAILALGTILIRYYNSAFRVGHKLKPSPQNRIQSNEDVTPDILAQGINLNLIGEVKKSFPQNEEWWLSDLKQIEKYDDNLTNWVNGQVENHDLMLLTHISRGPKLRSFLERKIAEGKIQFNRPLSIIEFTRDSQISTFWHLRKSWGIISNKTLDNHLTVETINLNGENIVSELSSVLFYDSEPIMPDLMNLIWIKVFPDKATTERYMEAAGKKIIELTFTVDEVVDKCRQYFSMPDSSLPKREWIKKAIEGLVKLNRAKKLVGENYLIYYHKIGPDTLRTFVKEWLDSSQDIREFIPQPEDSTDNQTLD